jgi:hypothetical protein
MCGRAAISIPPHDVVKACRDAGLPLPSNALAPDHYRHAVTCKAAKNRSDGGRHKLATEQWPCVVSEGGELGLRTLLWGMPRLSTHCIWVDGGDWLNRQTWQGCLEGGRRCAVAVTAFAEGITCRKSDSTRPLFFLAALHNATQFVLVTTNACDVPLLCERARPQAAHGVPTRCPLIMDSAEAARWVAGGAPFTSAEAMAAVQRLETFTRANSVGLVLGAAASASSSPGAKQRARGGKPGVASSAPSPWASAAAARPAVSAAASATSEEAQLAAAIALSLEEARRDAGARKRPHDDAGEDEREIARRARLERFGPPAPAPPPAAAPAESSAPAAADVIEISDTE